MNKLLNLDELRLLFGKAKLIRAQGYSKLNANRDYSAAKRPVDQGWNLGTVEPLNWQEAIKWVQQEGWLGLVVPEGFIVIDIDDKLEGTIVREILTQTRIKHHAIMTINGWQFIFKDAGSVRTQETKALTMGGFIVDFRLQGKGYIILPFEGSTLGREWVDVCQAEIDEMPFWLVPTGKRKNHRSFSLPIHEGERNDSLYRHGCMLQSLAFPDQTIWQTLQFMADNACIPPYDHSELATTLKQIVKLEKGKNSAVNVDYLDEWEDPLLFNDFELPIFPVDLFPPWIRDLVEDFTTRLQVPIDAPCMAALSVLSTALAKKIVISIPSQQWKERINLYCATVMPPGEKKSETLRVFTAPLYKFQSKEVERLKPLYELQQAEREAKKKRLDYLDKRYGATGDPMFLKEKILLNSELTKESLIYLPQFVTTDVTPERLVGLMQENNERMAILSAEGGIFATMAGRYSGGIPNLDVFLMSYSGDSLTVDRQGRKEQLNEPALSLGMFIQPEVMARLPEEMVGRGLLARFLFSLPQTKVGYRTLQTITPNQQAMDLYENNVYRLLNIKDGIQNLYLTEEAYSVFSKFYHRVEHAFIEGAELSSPTLQAWGNKLPGTMLRVAGLVHVAEHSAMSDIPSSISAETMKMTVKAGEYFIAHAKAVFGSFGMDQHTKDAKFLLRVIRRQDNDIFPLRTIQQLTKNYWKDSNDFKRSLALLENRGFIKQRKIEGKVFILVNPHLSSTESAPNAPIIERISDLGAMGALEVATSIDEIFVEDKSDAPNAPIMDKISDLGAMGALKVATSNDEKFVADESDAPNAPIIEKINGAMEALKAATTNDEKFVAVDESEDLLI